MRQQLLWICIASVLAMGSAGAGVYDVAAIRVHAEAATAAEARARALRQGQIRALEIVLRRLAAQADWSRLPEAASLDIETLVAQFRVRDEKTATRRYSAELFVQFAPDLVRAVLRQQGIAMSETQSRPALLIPVLEDTRGLQAWGEHWWQAVWRNKDLDNNSAPLILPLGDSDDTASTTAEEILQGNPLKLADLNRRYGTDTVVVAHALADSAAQFGVTLYIFSEDESDVIVRAYRVADNQQEVAAQAADELLAALGERWKKTAAIAGDSETVLQLRAMFPDLPTWLKMLQVLGGTSLVRDATIIDLSVRYAYLRVRFSGSAAQLAEQLDRQGLHLFNNTEASASGEWHLVRRQ